MPAVWAFFVLLLAGIGRGNQQQQQQLEFGFRLDGVVLQCWTYAPIGFRKWKYCCAPLSPAGNRSGLWAKPPRQRDWCWYTAPEQIFGTAIRVSYDECCEHRTPFTLESLFQSKAQSVLPLPGRGCSGDLTYICDLAWQRTRAARLTRRKVSVLAKAGGAAPRAVPEAIPVLGFPVAHDPDGKYALRLLRSIDFPVTRLIIVLNDQGVQTKSHDPPWVREATNLHPGVEILRPGANLGCAGGWNAVVEASHWAPYWLICNNDVAFPRGSLERIAATMAEMDSDWNSNRSEDGLPLILRSFQLRGGINNLPAFVLTREAVARVGLFDENFWPVYGEDADYFARMRLLGQRKASHDASIEVIHGPEDWVEESMGHYSGTEQFIGAHRTDAAAKAQAWLQSADNNKAFCRKYGPVERSSCADLEYGAVGPYGVLGADGIHGAGSWDDWILDPSRRICILLGGDHCGFDRRLLEAEYAQ